MDRLKKNDGRVYKARDMRSYNESVIINFGFVYHNYCQHHTGMISVAFVSKLFILHSFTTHTLLQQLTHPGASSKHSCVF